MNVYRLIDGQPLEHSVGSLIESAEYQIEVDADTIFFSGRELEPVRGVKNRWHLQTPFAVGKGLFTIVDGQNKYTKTIIVKANPKKIESKRLWEQMLEDLLHWTDSLVGHQGIRGVGIDVGPLQHYLLLEGLVPLLKRFQISLTHLFDNLRVRTIYPNQQIRLTNLRAPYPLREIIRSPKTVAYLEGHGVDDVPVIETPRPLDTLNHPVNRYVRWLVDSVIRYLNKAIIELKPDEKVKESRETLWRYSRTIVLEEELKNIQRLLQHSPIHRVPPEQMRDAAFLVVLNDPLYAAVHKIGRILCGQALTLQQTKYAASMARSFDIYELWCFQKVVSDFSRSFGVEPSYQDNGLSLVSAEWGMTAHFQTADCSLTVEFNAHFESRFPTFPFGTTVTRRFSTMTNQRPDIVVYRTDTTSGQESWIVLDAKYRTSKSNLSDAFKSAFTYNQTLFDQEHGGRPLGSYLLVPKVLHETKQWFTDEFIQTYPYGAFEVKPNQDSNLVLKLFQLFRS